MKRQPKKGPRLSRRELAKLAADLAQRLNKMGLELAAIRHTHAPNGEQIVAEYYARAAFGIALDHQARRLRDIGVLTRSYTNKLPGKRCNRKPYAPALLSKPDRDWGYTQLPYAKLRTARLLQCIVMVI